jgi:nucleoside-diphosphate-sugar epimerase
MRILVTGSSGHLGEALVRVLRASGHDVVGLDVLQSPFTDVVGSVTDVATVRDSLRAVEAVIHTATLHKPHVATQAKESFIDVNVLGTLVLLEQAVAANVGRFVYTSTTSAFGRALTPPPGAPAAWITEAARSEPKNIYGMSKVSAEDLCALIAFEAGLPCVVLRMSRFFPEADDVDDRRQAFDDTNLKVNELLYRRVDLEDAVRAHELAVQRAPQIGFGRFIISATSPFARADLAELRRDAPSVVARHYPQYEDLFAAHGWRMLPSIDRVYVNDAARSTLGWQPRFTFGYALERLEAGAPVFSDLTSSVGYKGYSG